MKRRICALSVSALLLLGACGGNGTDLPPGATEEPTPNTSGNPKVSIASPKDGDEVDINDVVVKVDVSGFTLTHKMGLEPVDGEGHLIYYVWNGFGEDGTTYAVPTTPGQPANSGGTGYVAVASAEKENAWSAFVQPGRQVFAAQLVNNDNTPLEPPQVAKVTVTVTGKRGEPADQSDEDDEGKDGGGGRGPND